MKMTKIGIIGGGQLGKMMILDGKRLGYYFVILDPSNHCPAHSIADEHIVADFDSIDAFFELAKKVDVITYEFEHINVKALEALEKEGYKVYPTAQTLASIQNKYEQKKWLQEAGIPVPKFTSIDSILDLHPDQLPFKLPVVLKTCTGGYDGKGNYIIKTSEDIETAYKTLGAGKVPLMVEEFIPFEKEISILACNDQKGNSIVFPIAENWHANSILDETIVPARLDQKTSQKAIEIADEVAKHVSSCGMLCIEMFVSKEGNVLVNEIAPRPHNSGHYTIEGCYTSQFEQHVRAIVGLPFGDTTLKQPTVMKNIIGETNIHHDIEVEGLQEALEEGQVKVHLYEKTSVSIGRKMGHITVGDETVEKALKKARKAHQKISFF
ncbi:5-(carboxyamino)imidazole ribonucleotide synthase [Natranaerovirga hydrolytica]|uniref:N5-carboxyaminoimidazole ribonucleotide synthase n=1 Tax=Natranaerovirga hydrolytica TaxID=680378 RepID=A0A4R1MDK4_9FIRM|nr:5-(carboxyamino)imidazole ribonucleotide synthase [Natranaerovirga hydrolytica]TCK90546.1 5-(carboxyamino)imidazole ribonucleotide synthase [Natranaerovirga hydrolytica]